MLARRPRCLVISGCPHHVHGTRNRSGTNSTEALSLFCNGVESIVRLAVIRRVGIKELWAYA